MTAFSRDEEAAKDGVSQAFTNALIHRFTLESMPEPAMKAWLYAASRNAVVDIKRRESRFVRFAGEDGEGEFADPRIVDPADKAAADQLLQKLPAALRQSVELKYFRGMNSTEIGEALNLPAATIRTRLRTAMLRLHKTFWR
jgi:RNA polymerase sigma-70 factor (ECF subfamily)